MKIQPTLLRLLVISAIFNLVYCKKKSDNNENITLLALAALDASSKQCETSYDNNAANDLGNLLELCRPQAGRGRHFRFENVGMTANNGYLNLLIGYGSYTANTNTSEFPQAAGFGPLAPTTTADDGRWRIFFGKSISCNLTWFVPYFSGTNSGTLSLHELFMTQSVSTTFNGTTCPVGQGGANQASGIWGPSTICMDITKGSNGSSPRITVWATGKNGADCNNLNTLNIVSKIYENKNWSSKVESRDDRIYIYRSNDSTSLSKIVVRSETVIKD